ncbi:MAG TPA: CHASE3 domain-containing protein [Casimicrobiaceae bacterium]|nr:CHASE3 domain-containing protein [Casimicrobiaceae bacterium]
MKRLMPLKVLLPLVLGAVVSLSILGFSELGYRRLDFANRAMSTALETQATLNEVLVLITEAETGQRGFLLTGDPSYLKPYRAAVPNVERALERLRDLLVLGGSNTMLERSGRLTNLIGQKLNELETTLTLNEKSGRVAAFQLLDTGIGQRTMDQIRVEARAILDELRQSAENGGARWTRDIEFARIGMLTMTAFTVALLVVVWSLARREIAAREEKRQMLVEERTHLETEVSARTAELWELSNYLQSVREEEKSRLARDIHDELGGILVGAKMDVSWVRDRVRDRDPEAAAKLERALQMLDEGVEMKRRVIEELRPTLLDNLGLAAAIEWQVKQTCERANLNCALNLPEVDESMPPQVTIALYRIAQEAMTNIVKYARARNVDVDLVETPQSVSLMIADDGVGLPAGADTNALSHGISGMRQRVRALNGEFRIRGKPGVGTTIEINIPLTGQAAAGEMEEAPPEEVTNGVSAAA